MRSGKAIAIWYSEEDRRRVQEAATLTGYRQVSKYIRDRSLGRDTAGANLQLQLDRQRLQDQHIERAFEELAPGLPCGPGQLASERAAPVDM